MWPQAGTGLKPSLHSRVAHGIRLKLLPGSVSFPALRRLSGFPAGFSWEHFLNKSLLRSPRPRACFWEPPPKTLRVPLWQPHTPRWDGGMRKEQILSKRDLGTSGGDKWKHRQFGELRSRHGGKGTSSLWWTLVEVPLPATPAIPLEHPLQATHRAWDYLIQSS